MKRYIFTLLLAFLLLPLVAHGQWDRARRGNASIASHDSLHLISLDVDSIYSATGTIVIKSDVKTLANFLFAMEATEFTYWTDADGDTVLIIDPNSTGAIVLINDKADTIFQVYGDHGNPGWTSADSTGLLVLSTGAVEIGNEMLNSAIPLTLKGNNGNNVKVMAYLTNTDEGLSGEINQTAEIWGWVQGTSNGGTSYTDALAGKIVFGKLSDYFNASGVGDNDSYIRLVVRDGGVSRNTFYAGNTYTAMEQGSDIIAWDGSALYSTDASYDLGKYGNRYQNAFISDATQIGVCYASAPALLTVNENSDTLAQFSGDKDGSLWSSADSAGLMQLPNGDVEIGNANTTADLTLFNGNIVNTGATRYFKVVSLADGAQHLLPTGVAGFGQVYCNDEWAHFTFTSAGAITLVSNTANVSTTEDNDTTLNIFDDGSGIGIENELGSTYNCLIDITHFTP